MLLLHCTLFVFRAVIGTLGLTDLSYCMFICILNCSLLTNKDGWMDGNEDNIFFKFFITHLLINHSDSETTWSTCALHGELHQSRSSACMYLLQAKIALKQNGPYITAGWGVE